MDIAGTKEERRAFHFFCSKSVADCTGLFDSGFWSRLVLQASHAEPSIRHAVIALGSLHETVQEEESKFLEGRRAYDPFALQQCNKAIGLLNQNLYSNRKHSNETLLMSCAVFIYFESLQGNYESALGHIQSGLRIFRDWQAEISKPSLGGTAASSKYQQGIDSDIVQMFSRLNLEALMFPDTHLFPMDFLKQDVSMVIDSVPNAFTSLKQAKDLLDNCMSYTFQSAAGAYFRGQSNNLHSGSPQDIINGDLISQWSTAFNAFVQSSGPKLGPEDLQRAMLLEIQYKCAKILVSVGMPPREAAFDDFQPEFGNIISLASSIIHGSGPIKSSERTIHFSFDMGIVPSLYFTATRCREPSIRRQALSLLSATSRQECIWNSKMLSKIAERLILIEEEREIIEQVAGSEPTSAMSWLTVLNATIYSEQRQVLVECCRQKCNSDEEICLLDAWILY